jgi:Na+/melibiose symporter-like transporter
VRIGYAMGSLATGAFGTVPGLLLLPYLTDTLGIAAGLAGSLVLLPKAWDVVVNPIAGRISDRTRTRWGARRPYLLGGGLSLAVLFALIFAGFFERNAGAAWVTAVLHAHRDGVSPFSRCPYVAMPAEMTESYDERTRMMTWRVALLATAILISGAVAPIVRNAAGGGIPGYRAMGIFVAVLIVFGALGAFFGTRNAPMGRVQESEPTLRAQLAVAARTPAVPGARGVASWSRPRGWPPCWPV